MDIGIPTLAPIRYLLIFFFSNFSNPPPSCLLGDLSQTILLVTGRTPVCHKRFSLARFNQARSIIEIEGVNTHMHAPSTPTRRNRIINIVIEILLPSPRPFSPHFPIFFFFAFLSRQRRTYDAYTGRLSVLVIRQKFTRPCNKLRGFRDNFRLSQMLSSANKLRVRVKQTLFRSHRQCPNAYVIS